MKSKAAKEPDNGFARTYGVELLYVEQPQWDVAAVVAAVQRWLPDAALMGPGKDFVALVHPTHPVQYKDGSVPAQTTLFSTDKLLDPQVFAQALEQSWSWPEARDAIRNARRTLLLTDLMSSALPYKDRLSLFNGVLAGVLETIPCVGIHWLPTSQLVPPDAFLAAIREHGLSWPLPGAVNVRFYRITGYGSDQSYGGGDMIMDTLGLGALGLIDLQCHFRALDPNAVSRVLFNSALYVYDADPHFENGHTIQGITASQKWPVHFEESLLEPKRVVLDLMPHQPHASRR